MYVSATELHGTRDEMHSRTLEEKYINPLVQLGFNTPPWMNPEMDEPNRQKISKDMVELNNIISHLDIIDIEVNIH